LSFALFDTNSRADHWLRITG